MLFARKLLNRAAELQNVTPQGLEEPGEGDKVLGVASPELLGLHAAYVEVKTAQREGCVVFRRKEEELGDDPDRKAELDAASAEHDRQHAEADFAKNAFWASVGLEYPETIENSAGLASYHCGQVAVVLHGAKETEDDESEGDGAESPAVSRLQALASHLGIRLQL